MYGKGNCSTKILPIFCVYNIKNIISHRSETATENMTTEILDQSKLKDPAEVQMTKIELYFRKRLSRKHCGKRKKMLVTIIFTLSHNVFNRLLSQS